MKRIKLLLIALILILTVTLFIGRVEASAPYKTYTVNRYNELVETQEAYSPMSSLNVVYDGLSISKAEDMIFDSDDYLYICDTGNKRIVVLDETLTPIYSFGSDILSYPRGIYKLENDIYITDYTAQTGGRIIVYTYDKASNTVALKNTFGTPSSWILEVEGAQYKPLKIAVSNNGYMYVTSEGSTSGVLMIDPDNNFITYFASNTPKYTFMDRAMYFLFEGTKWADRNRQIPNAPYNVMLNDSGYVYTITKSDFDSDGYTDNFKKVNTGGQNYFPDQMIGATDFVDSYSGKYGNTYAVTQSGQIFEYDNEGGLLFKFAGKGDNLDVYGLFSSASSIAVDSKDNLYVIDNSRNNLQIFKPNTYCNLVHEALALYNDAKYEEALDIWIEVLRYNSMFDLAHKGVGLAYYMSGRYDEALEEFYIAYDKVDYSESFWEIRNVYLIDNLSKIFTICLIVIIAIVIIVLTNKKFHYLRFIAYPFKKVYEVNIINQTIYEFRFLRHPGDTLYEIKHNKRAGVLSSFILLLIIFGLYLLGMVSTGFIFNNVIIEETILLTEGIKIIIPIVLFVIANYLMSSLMEGEGTFKNIFIATMGSLTPVIVIYPLVILISNVLTLNESFLYYFLIVVMFIWVGVMLFYNIKEVHNYSVPQTIVNILLTVFMLVILILVVLMIYVMGYQIFSFIEDIVKEVIINA